MRLGSPSHASIGSPRERVLSQAVMIWFCLVVLAAVHSGCRAEKTAPEIRRVAGVGEAAEESQPALMSEEAIFSALLEDGQVATASPEFVQAVRTVNGLGGTVSFDQQGRLVAVDLARDRIDVAATDLERLAAFPHLKRLQVAGSSLGNAQLHWIADRWDALEELALHYASVDDQGVVACEQLAHLEVLSLRATVNLTDQGLESLARLPKLRHLSLVENQITGEGLRRLGSAVGLEVLDLRGCSEIGSEDLAALAKLPRLRVLRLAGPQVRDTALAELQRLGGLRSVTVEDAPITDEGLAHLATLPLTDVIISRCYQISDDGVERLTARLEGLQHLALRDVPIRGSGLASLRSRASLRTLRLNETFVDDQAMQHLEGAGNLERLEVREGQVGDAGAEILGTLRALQHLDLSDNRLSDAGVAHLIDLERLRVLNLSGNNAVTDRAVETLARMTSLEELSIARTAISEESTALLQRHLPLCRILQ